MKHNGKWIHHTNLEADKNLRREYGKATGKFIETAGETPLTIHISLKKISNFFRGNPKTVSAIALGVGAVLGVAIFKLFAGRKSAGA